MDSDLPYRVAHFIKPPCLKLHCQIHASCKVMALMAMMVMMVVVVVVTAMG